MLGLAHFQIGGAGHGRARVDQVGRVQLLGAFLALVAAGTLIAAVGAGALDIAVGQETAVGVGVDLFLGHFADQACFGQLACEMLGQRVVLRAGGAAEMVERQGKALGDLRLDGVHLGTVFRHRLVRLGSGQFRRCAVLVGGAEEHHLIAASALEPGIQVGRQLAAHQVAQMLDPVDVGDRRSDQNACHAIHPGNTSKARLAHGTRGGNPACGIRWNLEACVQFMLDLQSALAHSRVVNLYLKPLKAHKGVTI